MSQSLHRCMTKATIGCGDQRKHGAKWATARRGLLKVYDDRIECGDWCIHYDEFNDAILYSFRSFFLMPGYILMVKTAHKTYHFGLNG